MKWLKENIYTIEKGSAITAIPIGNFGKGRPLKKRAGVA